MQVTSGGYVTLFLFVDARGETPKSPGEAKHAAGTWSNRVESVLFVCLGNTDRSAAAVAWMRRLSPTTRVASRALAPHFTGSRASVAAVDAAMACGLDLSSHRAGAVVTAEDLAAYDRVVAFDRTDLSDVRSIFKSRRDAKEKTRLLLDYTGAGGGELPDPHTAGDHAKAISTIETGIRALLKAECLPCIDSGLLDAMSSMRRELATARQEAASAGLAAKERDAARALAQRTQAFCKRQAGHVTQLLQANAKLKSELQAACDDAGELASRLEQSQGKLDAAVRKTREVQAESAQTAAKLEKCIRTKDSTITAMRRELAKLRSQLQDERLGKAALAGRLKAIMT